MEILAIYIGVELLSEGGNTRTAALLNMGSKLKGWQPFTAANTLHSLTILHYLLEFLHPIVFLLQDLASALHFLQG